MYDCRRRAHTDTSICRVADECVIENDGAAQRVTERMSELSADAVRQFLLAKYSDLIRATGADPANAPDDFDLLLTGVIDSFGILEMIGAIEDEFRIQLDMATLDAEQITILGPLSRYVAKNATSNISPGR